MIRQIVEAFRVAEARQIMRTGAVNLREFAERAGDESRVFKRTHPDHAVEAFAHHIDQPVATAQFDFNAGILL